MANDAETADHLRTTPRSVEGWTFSCTLEECENESVFDPLRRGEYSREDGLVYFIKAAGEDSLKIGWTRDLQARLRNLQTSNPRRLRVIGAVYGDRQLEVEIAHFFRRVRGEWVVWDEEAAKFVERLRPFMI